MDFDLTCKETLATVSALLATQTSDMTDRVEQLEAAFWHLRTCISCRSSLTSQEHGRFVNEVALVRD